MYNMQISLHRVKLTVQWNLLLRQQFYTSLNLRCTHEPRTLRFAHCGQIFIYSNNSPNCLVYITPHIAFHTLRFTHCGQSFFSPNLPQCAGSMCIVYYKNIWREIWKYRHVLIYENRLWRGNFNTVLKSSQSLHLVHLWAQLIFMILIKSYSLCKTHNVIELRVLLN